MHGEYSFRWKEWLQGRVMWLQCSLIEFAQSWPEIFLNWLEYWVPRGNLVSIFGELENFGVNFVTYNTYSSSRCNCSDSGSGWRGTHPSRTAILPTFVSTFTNRQSNHLNCTNLLSLVSSTLSVFYTWNSLGTQDDEVLGAAHIPRFSTPTPVYLADNPWKIKIFQKPGNILWHLMNCLLSFA
jgi:hypothetical protein